MCITFLPCVVQVVTALLGNMDRIGVWLAHIWAGGVDVVDA